MEKDKQIIIDGVDVHWCEHYTGNIGYLTDKNWTCRAKIQGTKCEDWSNCYFKRWQRKEQECKELKKIINEAKNSKLDLKSFLVGEAVQNEYEQQLDQLKAENKHLNDLLNQALKDYDKARQTLTEIKDYCNKYPQNSIGFKQQILQKISEVENG